MEFRIAIFHPEGNVLNNPNLFGMVEILCEQGYSVDIISGANPQIPQQAPCKNSRFVAVDQSLFPNRDRLLIADQVVGEADIYKDLVHSSFSRYDLVIGVDRGIIEAAVVADVFDVPLGLISYEIYFADELGLDFKLPEIEACKKISFAICQDKVRSAALCNENKIALTKIIEIPVAGRGFFENPRSWAVHEELGLDPNLKIMLAMGSVTSAWTGLSEIILGMGELVGEWVLVLHHRFDSESMKGLNENLRKNGLPNVLVSPFPTLAFSDMGRLVNSVDIGIGSYKPIPGDPFANKNLQFIGMASGKISTYLQHGLPVVSNELGEISDCIRAGDLGLVADQISQIPEVLKGVSREELQKKSRNCREFFEKRLDLNLTIQPMLRRIGELKGQKYLN